MLLFYGEMFTLVKRTVHSVCGYSCFYCLRQRSLHYGFLHCAHNVKWVHTLQAGIYVVRYTEWISTLSYVPLISFLFIYFNKLFNNFAAIIPASASIQIYFNFSIKHLSTTVFKTFFVFRLGSLYNFFLNSFVQI